jgi:diguanylate cyclase (GGDEF)-like protein/PAS domain S-box-containing protein
MSVVTISDTGSVRRRFIRRVVFGYAFGALAWVFVANPALLFIHDLDPQSVWRLGRGVFFVVVTTLLLNFVLRRIDWEPLPVQAVGARRRGGMLVGTGAIMVAVILAIGALGYWEAVDWLKAYRLSDLQAVGGMKVDGIEAWLGSRRTGVLDFASRGGARRDVVAWRQNGDLVARDQLLAGMRASARVNGAESAVLLDPAGKILLSTRTGVLDLEHPGLTDGVEIPKQGSELIDLHHSPEGGAWQLGFIAPILATDAPDAPIIAGLRFEFSAQQFLFPFLRHQPLSTRTGEFLLVRRAGEDIQILDTVDPRRPDAPARPLTIPISGHDTPAARYFAGEGSTFMGNDYRGVPVLAAILPIAGTGWALGTKEDVDEAFAGLRGIALLISLLTALALAVAIGSISAIWQRQRLQAAVFDMAQQRLISGLEQRFRTTFEQAPVGIAHLTLDLVIILTNKKMTELLGFEPGGLVGVDVRTRIHPEDLNAYDRVLELLLQGYSMPPGLTERRFLREDGSVITLSVSGAVIRGPEGQPEYRVGFYTDVTDREAAQALLTESEARFRSYVEVAPISILAADRSGRYIDSNPAASALLGYDPQEILQLTFSETLAEEDRARALADFAAPMGEQNLHAEYQFRRRDGSLVPVELTTVRLADHRYMAYAQDITLRRQAEADLLERSRLQDQMMRISASVPGLIYAFERKADGSFCLPFVTARVQDILGLAPGSIAKDALALAARIHPGDRAAFMASMTESALDLSPWDMEFRYFHPSKGLRWLDAHSLPRAESDDSVIWFGFVSDATDRKKDAASLRDVTAALANSEEGAFILDLDSIITSVNTRFCLNTGYEQDEIVGQNIGQLRSNRHGGEFFAAMASPVLEIGSWQGEVWFERKSGDVYPVFLTMTVVRDERGRPAKYVATFTDISEVKEQATRLERLVNYDMMTGLPNRSVFMERLDQALGRSGRSGRRGAVMVIGLDRFKLVSESLGRSSGDDALRILGGRLRGRLREVDALARLGGDEFAIVLEDLNSDEDAGHIAESMITHILEPISLPTGREIVIGASIGISLFPIEGASGDQVLRNAVAALQHAKAEGRGTHRYYSPNLTIGVSERFDLEGRLRRAVEHSEFVVHYQPLFALDDRRLTGVEALVRWEDPDLGRIPPNNFIGLAEETGLIVPLGEWVLRTACAQMQAWRTDGTLAGTVAVNLSPVQFRQPDIVARIGAVLAETGLPGHALELEIAEGALIGESAKTQETLTALKALGIRLAIDDFGTGYSSLAYLKRFPIDKLKIDQSFVRDIPRDPADMEIAHAIISLARSLNLECLAEGIETEPQFEFLKAHGCKSGQGYLIARPMSAEDLTRFIARYQGS